MKVSNVLLLATAMSLSMALPSYAAEPISPIKPAVVKDAKLVELGKKLFFDPRLSKSGFISCNSCHNLSMGGTDNLKTSIGHNWQQGPDQRADRAELQPQRRAVLGRPRA